MSESPEILLSERVRSVHSRLEKACRDSGRDPGDVLLLAVSKTRSPDEVSAVAQEGIRCFGENRVQEAAAKIPLCPGHLSWHLIGHLQRNKSRQAVQLFEVIHSIDSLELLQRLDRDADEVGKSIRGFLQINVSGESSKSGMKPEQLREVLEASTRLQRVTLDGLMTIPPFTEDPEGARPVFSALSQLKTQAGDWGFPLQHLSMGMSHDFEIAIAEGATMVRVGSDIFGPRATPGI